MLRETREILARFPVRKTRKQRLDFLTALLSCAKKAGYTGYVERGCLGSMNLVIGNPEQAQFLVTADYDTPPGLQLRNSVRVCANLMTFLEILSSLPKNLQDKVCFLLFDGHLTGKIGLASYRRAHMEAAERQVVLNLDDVGDGDDLVFCPNKNFCEDREKMLHLCKCVGRFGSKTIAIRSKSAHGICPNYRGFRYGIGIAAFRRRKIPAFYCKRHYTEIDLTNVNILRAALISYISSDAAQ